MINKKIVPDAHKSFEMPRKGEPIRIVRGNYAGCIAWYDKSKKMKKKNSPDVHVIIQEDDDDPDELTYTHIRKTSIRKPFEGQPASHAEACIWQHSDIEQTMSKLAQMSAECQVTNSSEITHLLQKELDRVHAELAKKKLKARYREVDFL